MFLRAMGLCNISFGDPVLTIILDHLTAEFTELNLNVMKCKFTVRNLRLSQVMEEMNM